MIISHRSASIRYSTDSVADGVRSFIAPAARLQRSHSAPATVAAVDFERLYPSLFAGSAQPFATRAARTALSAGAGIAAALVAMWHT